MGLRKRIAAAVAVVALAGTAALAGAGAATAATPSCGGGTTTTIGCVDLFSRDFGTHRTPAFVLDTLRQGAKVGQPEILFRTSNSDPAEDFTVSIQGTVADFYAAGLVTSSFALHYGCVAGSNFPNCLGGTDDYAFELEYAPFGVESGLCAGVASTASQGEGVSLQPCGVSGKTVWAIDQADSSTGRMTPVLDEYVPLINGSNTQFSHPYVLTYPAAGFPTDKPRPQLQVRQLTGFTQPGNGDPAGVDSSQLWGVDLGVLK